MSLYVANMLGLRVIRHISATAALTCASALTYLYIYNAQYSILLDHILYFCVNIAYIVLSYYVYCAAQYMYVCVYMYIFMRVYKYVCIYLFFQYIYSICIYSCYFTFFAYFFYVHLPCHKNFTVQSGPV